MHDPMTFDAHLADAFDRYLAGAPTDVDAAALTAAVAARPARRFAWPAFGNARLALAIGLLALAAVGAALLAGALLGRPSQPLQGRIVVTFPNGPSSVIELGGAAPVVREVALRGCPHLVGNADATFENIRFTGIRYTGFESGRSAPISTNYGGGERGSADGSVLALLNWTLSRVVLISIAGNDAANPVQTIVEPDLAAVAPDLDGTRSFDGSFSPDSRWFLLETNDYTEPVTSTFSLVDVRDGTVRPLATVPSPSGPRMSMTAPPAWAADDSAVALVSSDGGMNQVATISTATGGVRWLGRPAGLAADAPLQIAAWAGDGSWVGVWADGRLWLVDPATATWHETTLPGPVTAATQEWPYPTPTTLVSSPDGRMAATLNGTLTVLDIESGTVRSEALGTVFAAWSPDRTAIAVLEAGVDGADPVVRSWDPWSDAGTTLLATLRGPGSPAARGGDGPCISWLPAVDR